MEKNEEFIMSPTVDFCFKKLMENPKVRKGFTAALLKVEPRCIQGTELLPTETEGDYPSDKLGILDVRIRLINGVQMNIEMQVRYFKYWDERAMFYLTRMFSGQLKKGEEYEELKKCIHVSILDFIHFEKDDTCYRTIHLRDDKTGEIYSDKLELQILELRKLPEAVQSGDDLIAWMRFFSGKTRKEFESMAKTNEYIGEAYDTLLELSSDEKERLAYEARQKAIWDYNSYMGSARREGLREGEKIGLQKGEEIGLQKGEAIGLQKGEEIGVQKGERDKTISVITKLLAKNMTDEEICEIAECDCALIDEVRN